MKKEEENVVVKHLFPSFNSLVRKRNIVFRSDMYVGILHATQLPTDGVKVDISSIYIYIPTYNMDE